MLSFGGGNGGPGCGAVSPYGNSGNQVVQLPLGGAHRSEASLDVRSSVGPVSRGH